MSPPPRPRSRLTSVLGASGAFSASGLCFARRRGCDLRRLRPCGRFWLVRQRLDLRLLDGLCLGHGRRLRHRLERLLGGLGDGGRLGLGASARWQPSRTAPVRQQSQARPWRSATAPASAPVSNRQAASRPSARQPQAWQVLSPSLRRCFPPVPARVEPLDRRHDRRSAVRRARRRSATDRRVLPASLPLWVSRVPSQGLGFAAAGLVSTVMACGLLLPGPGTVMSTDCNAAAPSRMPPAASTRRGSFGRSLWVTAEGVGVARLPTEPVTPNPAYLSRGLPPMLDLYFGPGACARRRSCRLCSRRFARAQLPSVTVAELSPNPQQNVVHLTFDFSPVGDA